MKTSFIKAKFCCTDEQPNALTWPPNKVSVHPCIGSTVIRIVLVYGDGLSAGDPLRQKGWCLCHLRTEEETTTMVLNKT